LGTSKNIPFMVTGVRVRSAADRLILGFLSRLPEVTPISQAAALSAQLMPSKRVACRLPGGGRHPFETNEAAHVVDEVPARTMPMVRISLAPIPFF